jgi:uncharacterized protein (DUF302 family)
MSNIKTQKRETAMVNKSNQWNIQDGNIQDEFGNEKLDIAFQGIIDAGFDQAIKEVENGLKKEGFGIISRIDMHVTLKEKIGVDLEKYTILGACNAPFSYQVLLSDPLAGLLLPCNVVVEEINSSETRISFIKPTAMLSLGQIGENDKISEIAVEVEKKISVVAENLFFQSMSK